MNDRIFLFISTKANDYVRGLGLFSNTEVGEKIIPITDIDRLYESRTHVSELIRLSRIENLPHISESILEPWAQKKNC